MNNTKNPLLSVCVPVFNGARYIEACVESVLSQDFKDFELLIIDNASTDNTLSVCATFADSRISIHCGTSNIGAHRNFKKCFELARGDFVMLLPCDDMLEPNSLASLATPLVSNTQVGLAFGRTKVINSLGEILKEPICAGSGVLNTEQALNFIIDNFNPIQHPLVRKSSYFQLGGFQKKFGAFSDIHLWTSIATLNKFIYFTGQINSCIRQHPAQGQQIIQNIRPNNLVELSNHYGINSIKSHKYKFGHSISFFRLTKFFSKLDLKVNKKTQNNLKLLSILAKSNIIKIIKSIIQFNKSQINFELLVLKKIFTHFGYGYMLKIYVTAMLMIIYEIKRKLFSQLAMLNFDALLKRLISFKLL